MLFCGVDGGASKTVALLGDEEGTVLGLGHGGPANYQVVGLEMAMDSVLRAVRDATRQVGVRVEEVDHFLLGLAGDDGPEDHATLEGGLRKQFRSFTLMNDSWIALRGGTRAGWGCVVICGSGANAAARRADGRRAILRGRTYEFGNKGGALDIARDALHWAFRAEEGTGPPTRLKEEVLLYFGEPDYDALVRRMVDAGPMGIFGALGLAPVVSRLAAEGDRVAQEILMDVGRHLGYSASGVIRRLGMEREEFDLVLAGGVFDGECPLLIDELTTTVHRTAPLARPRRPEYEPVVGAFLLALEANGIEVDERIYERIATTKAKLGGRS